MGKLNYVPLQFPASAAVGTLSNVIDVTGAEALLVFGKSVTVAGGVIQARGWVAPTPPVWAGADTSTTPADDTQWVTTGWNRADNETMNAPGPFAALALTPQVWLIPVEHLNYVRFRVTAALPATAPDIQYAVLPKNPRPRVLPQGATMPVSGTVTANVNNTAPTFWGFITGVGTYNNATGLTADTALTAKHVNVRNGVTLLTEAFVHNSSASPITLSIYDTLAAAVPVSVAPAVGADSRNHFPAAQLTVAAGQTGHLNLPTEGLRLIGGLGVKVSGGAGLTDTAAFAAGANIRLGYRAI
jgi:hypothetical protein